jgi:hypothetical protein
MGITVLAFTATLLTASNPYPVAAQGETMFYLVKFEATGAGAPTTREQAIELLDKLVVPSLEKLAKEGRIRAGGLLVGARAGVFIVEARSHDEVTDLVRALPAWGVWGWKVKPLESFAHRAALEKKMVQELRTRSREMRHCWPANNASFFFSTLRVSRAARYGWRRIRSSVDTMALRVSSRNCRAR